MRRSFTRNLQAMLRPVEEGEDVSLLGFTPDGDIELPEDFEWHDFTVFLLHVASEIEHALMVQYLYAAYSVGGPGLSDPQREQARVWREIILGIAKEEMAHLITVQNVLRAIGGPLHVEREDYPYRSEFYPFPFRLERLTKTSLARYIYAEAPDQWVGVEAEEIKRRAEQGSAEPLNRVGQLYAALIKVIQAPDRITTFLPRTERYQASWDEWGRGYRLGQRGNQSGQNVAGTPDLLIDRVTDRASAVRALENIARQGEATVAGNTQSHFTRFIAIYRQLDENNPPSRNLPESPTTNSVDTQGRTLISNLSSARWARLFDLRYRMLLYRLKHAFYARPGIDPNVPDERGALIAWVFAEMYNLRAIAGVVIQLPLTDQNDGRVAGPPFEMAYTLSLPDWDSDKWRLHRDLIANSRKLTGLIRGSGDSQADFLNALDDHDELADGIASTLMTAALQREGA